MTHESKGKDPNQIEAGIAQTRAAISEDLNQIEQKLTPENLKQQAKEKLGEAFGEAKDAAVDKLRSAKDSAVESMGEMLEEAGTRAKRAGYFAKENALPLALIGIGAGWLYVSARRRRRDEEWDTERGWEPERRSRDMKTGERARMRRRVEGSFETARERLGGFAERASERVDQGMQQAREQAHSVSERAGELGRRAQTQLKRAEERAVDYSRENPMAIGAAALAAGVGVGLLLPSTRPEDRLLGSRRDRLIGDVRETVEEVGRSVKETARDVKGAVTQPLR